MIKRHSPFVLYRLENLLLMVAAVLVALFFWASVNRQDASNQAQFDQVTDVAVAALHTRMRLYIQSLAGTAAFLSASTHVDADDFKQFVETLDIERTLPGISGIGLIEQVADADLNTFVRDVKNNGQPDYQLRNLSDAEQHYLVKFIYPLETNMRARGLDVTFEPTRTAVLEEARDTGRISLTAPLVLVQHEKTQAGFLLFYPVFTGATADGTRQFEGWVYAPFIAENLLSDLTPDQGRYFAMSISDAQATDGDGLIFSGVTPDMEMGAYRASHRITQFGRVWDVNFMSTKAFDAAVTTGQPYRVLGLGVLACLLLLMTLRNLRMRGDAMTELANLRKRQVEASENQSRSIIENAVTPVMVLDRRDDILFANAAALACFGYSEAEMRGLPFSDLVVEKGDGDGVIGYTKSHHVLSLELQRNSWVNIDKEPRTTAIVRDVTAERAAQRELSRTKTLYDMALHGSRIGVFDIDLVTGTSKVSDTWYQIMGYEDSCNGAEAQQLFESRVHPDDRKRIKAADTECIEGRSARSIVEYRMRFGADTWRWMRSDAVVVERDPAGRALRLVGTQSDVTEIHHARNALEASEQLFRKVLAAAPIGMALMDDRGKFVGVNEAFCTLSGLDEKTLLGGTRLGDIMPRAEVRKIYAGVSDLIEVTGPKIYHAEHLIGTDATQQRWGLFNITWTYDKNAKRNFYIAQVNDITDQKQLAQIKDEFVATVSHELRTPLTSITGALGLLQAGDNSAFSAAQTRLMEIAKSNADRLTSIVNDILDLEKISSGQVDFHYVDFDLRTAITQTAEQIEPFAQKHANTLRCQLPDKPMFVNGDIGRTHQVLTNLISNACKYSFPDSEVVVRAETLGDVGIVYVQNTGPGVPDSFRTKIFQAFSQADSSDTRSEGGTGLGLNITRQIVNRHNGQVGFESIQNGITVFWFTYPLSTNRSAEAEAGLPDAADSPAPKMRVLHVEDDAEFAEIVATALHDVATLAHAKTVGHARQIISRNTFDVVILDWRLTDGDASELLNPISRNNPDARIISLSADSERAADPRLAARVLKGQAGLSQLVGAIRTYRKIAS